METATPRKQYKKGELIFREGEAGNCLYEIESGRVGIYAGYGGAEEKLLTELSAGATFGEMAMIEAQPRSATAAALADGTRLSVITWETLGEFFRDKPSKVVVIMQQMARRIRELTSDYLEACGAIHEMAERAQEQKRAGEAAWIQDRMRRYLDAYGALGGGRRM